MEGEESGEGDGGGGGEREGDKNDTIDQSKDRRKEF